MSAATLPAFDAYEVHPCAIIGIGDDGNAIVEQCNRNDPDISLWSLYGHLPTGGVECISDHASESEAMEAMTQIKPT